MSNTFIVWGNIGDDADVRYTQEGQCVARFSVAEKSKWKDKATGEKKEKTQWHNCFCFDNLAELCKQVIKKGKPIALIGEIQYRKDAGNVERIFTNIKVKEFRVTELQEKMIDNPPPLALPSEDW